MTQNNVNTEIQPIDTPNHLQTPVERATNMNQPINVNRQNAVNQQDGLKPQPVFDRKRRFAGLGHLTVVLAALLLFSACSPEDPNGPSAIGTVGNQPGSETDQADTDSGPSVLGNLSVQRYSNSSTRAVVVAAAVEVFDQPDGVVFDTLSQATVFGTRRVLLVEESRDDWVKVRLAARPNHRTGWIPAAAVELDAMELEVFVDLDARSLSVRSGIDVVIESPVAIGAPEYPTPTGTFYITDKLETPDPQGAYGPYAFGLSGYSETLTEFAGGDGQIGIHGTNDPESIGRNISHGCIRLPNSVIGELAASLPLGTPVHIV